jgi:hypothetical protein
MNRPHRDGALPVHDVIESYYAVCGCTDHGGVRQLVYPKVRECVYCMFLEYIFSCAPKLLSYFQVCFKNSAKGTTFTVDVKPQQRCLYGSDGVLLFSRWQVPLCSARWMKCGMSLGMTSPDNVFVDLAQFGEGETQRFMAMTRTGTCLLKNTRWNLLVVG